MENVKTIGTVWQICPRIIKIEGENFCLTDF